MKLLLLLLVVSASYGQKHFPDILPGLSVSEGDTVYLGKGTMPNGDYKYIYQKPNILSMAATPLSKFYTNKFAIIRQVERFDSKQTGPQNRLLVKMPAFTYYVDLTPAVEVGEVVGINQHSFIRSAVQPESVATQLREFKKLLDEGAITQEEFNTQKAKLLKQ